MARAMSRTTLTILTLGLMTSACTSRIDPSEGADATGEEDTSSSATAGEPASASGADETGGENTLCGNGILDEDEDCDDGNLEDADGCNVDCRVSGSVVWTVDFEAEEGSRSASSVAVDSRDFITMATSHRNPETVEIRVHHLDTDGVEQWTDAVPDGAWIGDLDTRPDDRIVVVGSSFDAAQGLLSLWIQHYATDGAIEQTFGAPGDGLNAVAITPAGALLTGGLAQLLALDPDPLWSRGVGYEIEGIAAAPNGGFVVVGHTGYDTGHIAWYEDWSARSGPSWSIDDPQSLNTDVALDSQGNIIVASERSEGGPPESVWVHKLAPDGSVLWQARPAEDGWNGPSGIAVAVDSHDRIVVAGHIPNGLDTNPWVGKLGPDGEPLWTFTIDDGEDGQARGVAINSQDEIVFTARVGSRGRLTKLTP